MCATASAVCTLRAANVEASALPGCDTITFALPAASLTIQPGAPLPTIVNHLVIDGTTQPGYTGSPIVEIDGSCAGMNGVGLRITAGSTVRALVNNRFS